MLHMDLMNKQKIDPKSQKFAENWLPIRAIQNGEIILDNGFRVTGVKVRPRNIFILDYNSQSNAIFNLSPLSKLVLPATLTIESCSLPPILTKS